ncbi:MAG: hypothetical protein ABGX98_08140 [Pseudomonadota bacterium]
MGAYKRFCHKCAEEGKMPVMPDTLEELIKLRDESQEFVEIVKHQYIGWNGDEHEADCITIESAISLQELGYKIEELDDFLDIWQDVIFDYCNDCGCDRQWIVEDNRRYCTDCG